MWGLVLTLNTDFWPGHKGFWYGIVSNAGSIISGIKWDVRIHCSVLQKKLVMLNFSAFE